MPDLGIDVLFKGTNMLRLLQGLWVAMNQYRIHSDQYASGYPGGGTDDGKK